MAQRNGTNAHSWLTRFRAQYNEAAADTSTELGVFYERHRNYVRYEWMLDRERVEYSDLEWGRVLASLFGQLAREDGLYQMPDWNGRNDIAWLEPGTPWTLAVLIGQANSADGAVLDDALPALTSTESYLSVLIMYPDYPSPEGARTLDEANEVWRSRIELHLKEHPPRGGFLLATIGANTWDLPAPWKGYAWDATEPALRLVP